MKLRSLPCSTTSLPISEIGLGCWQLGGSDWGAIDDDKAFEILEAAIDAGVNFFDTADVYGAGRSEELIGRFLKKSSSRIFVATKLGRTSALYPNGYTEAAVRAATEASLRRLGVEALDLTQLHCIPPAVLRQGEVFDWLRQLQQEGKIRRFGASVESDDQASICLQQNGLASLQIIFNVLRQKPAFQLLDEAAKRGVAIIVRFLWPAARSLENLPQPPNFPRTTIATTTETARHSTSARHLLASRMRRPSPFATSSRASFRQLGPWRSWPSAGSWIMRRSPPSSPVRAARIRSWRTPGSLTCHRCHLSCMPSCATFTMYRSPATSGVFTEFRGWMGSVRAW